MLGKHNTNWEARYATGDAPWEDAKPSPEMQQLFSHFLSPEADILELGCGSGIDAAWLVERGHHYHGIDISPTAIANAETLVKAENASFAAADAFTLAKPTKQEAWGVVYERGFFHTFTSPKERQKCAKAIASQLKEGGFWVSICGNSDQPESLLERKRGGWPRLSATDILSAAEPYFELHYMARCYYGTTEGSTSFLGWSCLFQKR